MILIIEAEGTTIEMTFISAFIISKGKDIEGTTLTFIQTAHNTISDTLLAAKVVRKGGFNAVFDSQAENFLSQTTESTEIQICW